MNTKSSKNSTCMLAANFKTLMWTLKPCQQQALPLIPATIKKSEPER